MFTLIRPIAALFLAVFSYYAAEAYEPLYDPDIDLGNFPWYAVRVGALVGWVFLGGQMGKPLWYSIYVTIQAVVLTAIGTAMYLAVGEVFTRGYRRVYREPFEAFTGYFEIVLDWLGRGIVPDYLLFLAGGGAVIGIVLHLIHGLMERRRNAR